MFQSVKPVNKAVKPLYAPVKPVYNTVRPIKKAEYSQIHPVPFLVSPAYSKQVLVKTSFSNYKPPHQYQTAFSILRPTYVPFQESVSPHHPSFNEIYDSPTASAPYFLPQALDSPISNQPKSYKPAPVQNHSPIHNLLVRPSPHHIVIKNPHPHPLAPPEHKKPQKNLKPDPFLVSVNYPSNFELIHLAYDSMMDDQILWLLAQYCANVYGQKKQKAHNYFCCCYGVGKRPPLYFFDKMHTTIH